MGRPRALALVAAVLVASTTIAVACGSADQASFAPNPEGQDGEGGTEPDGNSQGMTPPEAGPDGELVTDGGGNFPDAAEDAGDCAETLTLVDDGTPVPSDCRSAVPALQGGALVKGKYHLVEVHLLAPKNYCDTQFVPVSIGGTAEITEGDAGGRLVFEAVFSANGTQIRSRSVLTPAAGNTSPLQADPICPDKPAGNVRYASQPGVASQQRQRLVILLPYGSGGALYHFEKLP